MEPSLAESLAQTMEPAMEHCWDRSLAASLVPQTASMMATTTEPDLAQMRDQGWAAMTDKSWESYLARLMMLPKATKKVLLCLVMTIEHLRDA